MHRAFVFFQLEPGGPKVSELFFGSSTTLLYDLFGRQPSRPPDELDRSGEKKTKFFFNYYSIERAELLTRTYSKVVVREIRTLEKRAR